MLSVIIDFWSDKSQYLFDLFVGYSIIALMELPDFMGNMRSGNKL
jgi:hypothetical protein